MTTMLEFLRDNRSEILTLTREHIFLVFLSTGLAIALGIPLGVLMTRVKVLRAPVLGFANVMQTVPSLALFGLLIPIGYIGGLGWRTAVTALSLYALLPIIRNTVTGILGIDPTVREAAAAIGMTDWQQLRMVELPLAMPVILTGIRVAVVISVGVATVAAAVGAGGLGTYIFRGLRQNDNNLLIVGALAAASLALFCDFAIGQIEKSFFVGRPQSKRRRLTVALTGLIIAAAVVFSFAPNGGSTNTSPSEAADVAGNGIIVGSKDFTESVILAEILAQLLEKDGLRVTRKLELGGSLPHTSLLSGDIDVYPEYTGTVFTTILGRPPQTDPAAVYEQTKIDYASKFNLSVSPPLGFANDFAILVRGETARKYNLKTISDAAPLAANWQAGFGQDFMSRSDGYAGFAKSYGFRFAKRPREMDLSLTYRALAAGELDVIAGNSTDGLIGALDLVQLTDDRRYFPPYQAVFIARNDAVGVLRTAFDELAGAISTDDMRRLNYEVDARKRPPKDVALEWINSRQNP